MLPPVPKEGVPVPGAGDGFAILAARYGAHVEWFDVTKTLRGRITDPTRRFTFDSKDIGGGTGRRSA